LEEVREIAASFNCDVITSVDRYLDIVPKDVNKGTSLKKLMNLIGISSDKVMVAGDTLNDLALFETGYAGVAVGKSEKALLDATKDYSLIYQANSAGAGGILEFMKHHDYFNPYL